MIVPVTRKEKLLNAIATNGNVDFSPKTREELFLFKILGADVNTPTPITRKELLYQHVADGTLPTFEPRTRLEKFIMAAAGVELELPVVLTREEYWWAEISDSAYETITGAIVHFISKRARAIKSLIANISYTQDLHGYANPWPAGGGKNVLPTLTEAQTVNGVTATPNADGSITLTGTATNIAYFDLITDFDSTAYAGYIVTGLPDGILCNSGSFNFRISKQSSRASTQDIGRTADGTYSNPTIVDNGVNLRFAIRININYEFPEEGITLYPMMRAAGTSGTFEPYSNICPISGFTGVNVTRAGKNLLPNNLTFTNGIRDDDGTHMASTISHYTSAVPIKSNTVYTFKGPPNSNYRVYFLSDGQSWISRTDIIRQREFSLTTQSNCKYIQIQCSNSVNLETAQLELGSTATDYEPYHGNTYSITFPAAAGTVYGGTLDVVSGLLTVDRAGVDLGTLTWEVLYTETNNKTIRTKLPLTLPHAQTRKIISENYKYQGTVTGASVLQHPDNLDIGLRTYYKEDRLGYDDIVYAVIPVSESPDGLLVYELAEPVTYQLTPTEVTALLGDNTIWADTGDVTVTY